MRLTIIGASGHGKVAADIAMQTGFRDICFLDDNASCNTCEKWPVIGNSEKAKELDGPFFIAIGNSSVRKRMMEQLSDKTFVSLVHPKAVVADSVVIGDGTIVTAGAVINPGTKIGRGVIVNTNSTVDHDCVIEDYVHIAIGAHIAGTAHIGTETWIGAGATIINNLSVCESCMIGAGAAVVKNIDEPGTYVGVPARKVK